MTPRGDPVFFSDHTHFILLGASGRHVYENPTGTRLSISKSERATLSLEEKRKRLLPARYVPGTPMMLCYSVNGPAPVWARSGGGGQLIPLEDDNLIAARVGTQAGASQEILLFGIGGPRQSWIIGRGLGGKGRTIFLLSAGNHILVAAQKAKLAKGRSGLSPVSRTASAVLLLTPGVSESINLLVGAGAGDADVVLVDRRHFIIAEPGIATLFRSQ